MKLTVWGAARQVTGSMHLLEINKGFKILVDCGMDYEKTSDYRDPNQTFPFNPSDVNALILTHAHIDHSGNIPNLIKQGFEGPIFMTHPTAVLSEFLLNDSLNIQRMEASGRKKNKKRRSFKYVRDGELLFGKKHIKRMLNQLVTIPYNTKEALNDAVTLSFHDAGHILGSASARIEITHDGKNHVVGFTGDLGNYGAPQMNDPEPMKNLDYLISESTYGGRTHQKTGLAKEELAHYIKETCVEKEGKLVIPAFSVGRTQSIIFTIHQLYRAGILPNIKVFTDSPLAIRSTKAYENNSHYLNEEAQDFIKKYGSLFEFPNLHIIENNQESELLSLLPEPCVIISAAGMVEGGRIQTHVKNNIEHEKNTILIAGYCSEGTLGHRLLQGQDFIEINHKKRPARAAIRRTDAFSAHPDHKGLIKYMNDSINDNLKSIFLVHGDEIRMDSLIEDMSFKSIFKPKKGQEFELS